MAYLSNWVPKIISNYYLKAVTTPKVKMLLEKPPSNRFIDQLSKHTNPWIGIFEDQTKTEIHFRQDFGNC
jgi:hypothetical protein